MNISWDTTNEMILTVQFRVDSNYDEKICSFTRMNE